MNVPNYKLRQLAIGIPCHCGDRPIIKAAAYYSTNNTIFIGAEKGHDKFLVYARDRKTDLSDAILLPGRYLLIGDPIAARPHIFTLSTTKKLSESWVKITPDDTLYKIRLLIAGAIKIVVDTSSLTPVIYQTPEYQQALIEKRLIEIPSCN